MSGKHSSKNSGSTKDKPEPVMPDPDNLQVDLRKLPTTGPVGVPATPLPPRERR